MPLETSVKALFASSVVGCPCLAVLACRGWVKSRSKNLFQRRTLLGLASVSLTCFNWLAFIVIIILGRTSTGAGIALFLDIWAPISVLMAVASTTLAFALTGVPRIQGASAAILPLSGWSAFLPDGTRHGESVQVPEPKRVAAVRG
jgi:hypothetical protein